MFTRFHVLVARVRGLLRGSGLDREFDQELEAHLAMARDEKIRQGLSEEEARRAARVELGGLTQLREAGRDARGLPWLGAYWLDVKLGVRLLARYPGLTVVSTLALAVAIAIVGGFHAATEFIVHPELPVPDGDRVVAIWNHDVRTGRRGVQTLGDVSAWRSAVGSVEDIAAFVTRERVVAAAAGPTRLVRAAEITSTAFRVLQVPPLLGRPLLSEDGEPGRPAVALIGFDLWQSAFARDPDIVGRTIRIGSAEHTVVGVMPDGFRFPFREQLWTPLRAPAAGLSPGEGPAVEFAVGRLAPGASLEDAAAELEVVGARVAADHPETHASFRPRVTPHARSQFDANEPGIITAIGVARVLVGFILLVAAVNVGTLVFARNSARAGEVALRAALGASRSRIVAQMFAEALVLASLAAAAGTVFIMWALQRLDEVFALAAAWGEEAPFWFHLRFEMSTAVVIVGLVLMCAVVTGILPALKLTHGDMQSRLRHLQEGISGLRFGRTATAVVVAQVALSVALLAVAGAQLRSFLDGWLSFSGNPRSRQAYLGTELRWDIAGGDAANLLEKDAARRATISRDLGDRLLLEPAVEGVTFDRYYGVRYFGQAEGSASTSVVHWSYVIAIEPNYFTVLGEPLRAGRSFEAAEGTAIRTAIVNEEFVRSVLQGGAPIGRRIVPIDPRSGRPAGEPLEIVGMARDSVSLDITQRGPGWRASPTLFVPLDRTAPPARMILHAPSGPAQFASRMTAIGSAMDPALVLHRPRLLDETDGTSEVFVQLYIAGAVFLVGSALLLSTAGIYAMMSFLVTQRTREIGIRTALGANRRQLVGEVFSRAARQLGAGVGAGLTLGFALSDGPLRLSDGLLAHGPGVAVAIALLIVGLGLAACGRPVRRALRIQPTEALRSDG